MWYDKKEKVVECWLPNYKFSNSTVTEVLFDDSNNSLKVGDKIVKFKWGKKENGCLLLIKSPMILIVRIGMVIQILVTVVK